MLTVCSGDQIGREILFVIVCFIIGLVETGFGMKKEIAWKRFFGMILLIVALFSMVGLPLGSELKALFLILGSVAVIIVAVLQAYWIGLFGALCGTGNANRGTPQDQLRV